MNCDVCGQPARDDELIQINGRWICAACKPLFLQQLTEGTLPPPPFPLPDGFDESVLGIVSLLSIAGKVVRRDWPAIAGITVLLVFAAGTSVAWFVVTFFERSVTIPASVSYAIEVVLDLLASFFTVATTVLFLNLDAIRRRASIPALSAETSSISTW